MTTTERRPLLALDGDSLAHRAYHALPKSIRRRRRPANALVGFTNFLLRLWEDEQPRALLVGWDTLDVPTYRHEALAAYQSGREFDDVAARAARPAARARRRVRLRRAKAAGYEADDFLAAACDARSAAAGRRRHRPTATCTSSRAKASRSCSPCAASSELARIGPAEVRERYGFEPEQVPDFIALRGDPSDKIPGARGVGARRRPRSCGSTARSRRRSRRGASRRRPTTSGSTGGSRRWTPRRRSRACRRGADLGAGGRARARVG